MGDALYGLLTGLLAGSFALCGATLTHHLYIKRWECERREAYRAELFTVKLQVYGELHGVYFELVSETMANAVEGFGAERFIKARGAVQDFVHRNRLFISERVYNLALKDLLDEHLTYTDIAAVRKVAFSQYQALAEACRMELGVEAVSDDLAKMFKERPPGRIKAWLARTKGEQNDIPDGDDKVSGEENKRQ